MTSLYFRWHCVFTCVVSGKINKRNKTFLFTHLLYKSSSMLYNVCQIMPQALNCLVSKPSVATERPQFASRSEHEMGRSVFGS